MLEHWEEVHEELAEDKRLRRARKRVVDRPDNLVVLVFHVNPISNLEERGGESAEQM